jgi:nicotinamidase-related amidase
MQSTSPEDNVEENIAPIDEVYEIDRREAALVLVDTWNKHPNRSHLARSGQIVQMRIAPLLPAVRAASIPVIYAPSPDVAPHYPQWKHAFAARTPTEPSAPAEWPPPDLRARTGRYARYRRLPDGVPHNYDGPFPDDWWWDGIAACIAPEPDDDVVATGAELHDILSARRIAFLFYAGFATNICMLHRDYGILAMGARGYLPILLRDCTTGIETRATLADFTTTRLAIQDVERRYYTADSGDLKRACRAVQVRRVPPKASEEPSRAGS